MRQRRLRMKHSKKYNKVKGYYDKGLWSKRMVHDAVVKAWITADEYTEITGDEYVVTSGTDD